MTVLPNKDPEVVVVGSANLDIVVSVPHHPVTGETVLGGDHLQIAGGKGANQAIASSRLGRSTAFIGCVGDDPPAATLRDALDGAQVNTSGLLTNTRTPTGLAMIAVDRSGDNAIVVSPGANATLTPAHIATAPYISDAPIVLLQLEIPMDTVVAAATMATGRVILNPAPASTLPPEALAAADLIVPNEIELAMLTDSPTIDALADVERAARKLDCDVVVTLGARGALVLADGLATHVPAPKVTPVDTTAAGDSFCAALADGILRGSVIEATRWAVRVGAATTLRPGASSSLPTPQEVEELLLDP